MSIQIEQAARGDKQLTQGEAVVQAVRDVLKGDYKEGVKVTLTDEQRKAVTEILVKGFTDRRIPLKPSPANEEKLKDGKQLNAYVKGLINNWLVKSPALNGKPKKVKPVTPAATPPAPGSQTSDAKPVEAPVVKPEVIVQEALKSGKDAAVTAIGSKKPPVPAIKK